MHCPTCGQQQISDQTRFCSQCGFPLIGIAEVIANNGIVPAHKTGLMGTTDSPRRRGIKQGVFIFLMAFLVVPLLALISLAANLEPFLPAIGAFLLGGGGILRTIYAFMFEPGVGSGNPLMPQSPNLASGTENRGALPPSYAVPASAYARPAGSWRDTNDLQRQPPDSVTDTTTKLLQKDEER